MGHRLSAITTRTGDDGTSGLADGTRLPKDHARFHAMGDVDELNSQLGLLRAQLKASLLEPQILADYAAEMGQVDEALRQVQNDLFNLGGQISCPGMTLLLPERLQQLDEWVARDNADLPRLSEFILPGGSLAAAQCHIARTLARRAERSLTALGHALEDGESQTALLRQYLNRLSDWLFILSRRINRALGQADVLWQRD